MCVYVCVFRPVCLFLLLYRVFPFNEQGHCTVLLHPIMPLAPWTLSLVQPYQNTMVFTHSRVYCTADGSLRAENAIRTQTHTLLKSLAEDSPTRAATLFVYGRSRAPDRTRLCFGGNRPRYKTTVRQERGLTGSGWVHLEPWSFPWSWCASPGSGWERARAAAPSHPGLVLRFQPFSGIISLLRPHSTAIFPRTH